MSGQRRLTLLVLVLSLCERTQSASYFIHFHQTVSRPTGAQTATGLSTEVSGPKLCCTSDTKKEKSKKVLRVLRPTLWNVDPPISASLKLTDVYLYVDIWLKMSKLTNKMKSADRRATPGMRCVGAERSSEEAKLVEELYTAL